MDIFIPVVDIAVHNKASMRLFNILSSGEIILTYISLHFFFNDFHLS